MALDIAKMKEKLNKSKTKGGYADRWKPKPGENVIRILPTEDGDPFKEFFLHWRVGGTSFICPKRTSGEECPVCEHVRSLYSENTELSKAAAKNYSAKARYMSPIYLRDEKKVVTWEYSKSIYDKLLSFVTDEDYGDITDPKTGVDIILTMTEKKGFGMVGDVAPKRKSSPLAPADEVPKILEQIPTSFAPAKTVSLAEIRQLMAKMSSSDSTTEKGSSSDEDDFQKRVNSLVGDSDSDDEPPLPF